MSRTNNIPGLRRPDPSQQQRIAQLWRDGTAPQSLRRRQLVLLGVAAGMGLLKALSTNIFGGVASCVLMLLVFSPMLLLWNSQISRIRKIADKLAAGAFQVSEAECEYAFPDRWTRHYLGKARVRLPDGTILKSVDMPYHLADQLRRHSGSFRVWLVLPDDESKPICFPK